MEFTAFVFPLLAKFAGPPSQASAPRPCKQPATHLATHRRAGQSSTVQLFKKSILKSSDAEAGIVDKDIEEYETLDEQLSAIDRYAKLDGYDLYNPWPIFLKATAYERFHKPKDACVVFERVIELGFDMPDPRNHLALNLIRLGQWDAAKEQLLLAQRMNQEALGTENHKLNFYKKLIGPHAPQWPTFPVPLIQAIQAYHDKKYAEARSLLRIAFIADDWEKEGKNPEEYLPQAVILYAAACTKCLNAHKRIKELSSFEPFSKMQNDEKYRYIHAMYTDTTSPIETLNLRSDQYVEQELASRDLIGAIDFCFWMALTCDAINLSEGLDEWKHKFGSWSSILTDGRPIKFDIYEQMIATL